jgi:multifunctional methyltransferase subunit TRM112
MKLLTLNFLTCARKACKPNPESFPLQPKECTLEILETDFNLLFLTNILPRLEWPALVTFTTELGLPGLKAEKPEREDLISDAEGGEVKVGGASEDQGGEIKENSGEVEQEGTQLAKDLHRLLMETTIQEGKLVCRVCGHEYAVKEGIANFLLPSHLV